MLTQFSRYFASLFSNGRTQPYVSTFSEHRTPRSVCLPRAQDRLWDIPAVSTRAPRPESRPLKSIQWIESSKGSAHPEKRMVISGRFADVCAELERLAAMDGA